QRRIVGIQNDGNPGIEQLADRVRLERCHRSRSDIARNTNLKRNIKPPQFLHQPWIVHRPNSMADPFRTDRERVPHTLRIRRLSRVAGEMQPRIASTSVQIAEPYRWAFGFEPSDANRNYAIVLPLRREFEHRSRRFGAPLPRGV